MTAEIEMSARRYLDSRGIFGPRQDREIEAAKDAERHVRDRFPSVAFRESFDPEKGRFFLDDPSSSTGRFSLAL